jgi:predicted nucleotidyltransferase component of viral defense system
MTLLLLDQIKRLVIVALVTDDILMETLVLKGGNAITIAYGLGNRGSADIDFSMEEDFADLQQTIQIISDNLAKTFAENDLLAFDVKVIEKPKTLPDDQRSFWGGYRIEFKVADAATVAKYGNQPERLRRASLELGTGEYKSKTFSVDISRFEYCGHKVAHTLDGFTYYVYPPQLLVFEKIRAICQQIPDYKTIVPSHSPRARARDFYDIYSLMENFDIDTESKEALSVLRQVFDAKKVPVHYLAQIKDYHDYHRTDFASVKKNVTDGDNLKSFDIYFDYVVKRFGSLAI